MSLGWGFGGEKGGEEEKKGARKLTLGDTSHGLSEASCFLGVLGVELEGV